MRVWITRAQPGAERTAFTVRALGHEPVVAPVIAVQDLRPDVPPAGTLAFTSANAVAAFARLSADRSACVFAVGDATARAARNAGFTEVRSAAGDGRALAALIASEAPDDLLWPCAAEIAFDLTEVVEGQVNVRRLPVYESVPIHPFPAPPAEIVLIQSPLAARLIAQGLDPESARGMTALALSEAAAAPLAGLPFAAVTVAERPDEAALLAPLGKPPPGV